MFKIGDVVYLHDDPNIKGRITKINDYYIYVKFYHHGYLAQPMAQYPYKYRRVDTQDFIWEE